MRRLLPCLAAMLVAAGCSPSLDELRQEPAAVAGTFPGDYKEMAACVAYALEPRYPVASIIRDRDRTATLTHTHYNLWDRRVLFEVRLMAVGSGQVAAEFRPAIFPGIWNEKIWPEVERCAGGDAHAASAQR